MKLIFDIYLRGAVSVLPLMKVMRMYFLLKVTMKLGQENSCSTQAADVWRELLQTEHLGSKSVKKRHNKHLNKHG